MKKTALLLGLITMFFSCQAFSQKEGKSNVNWINITQLDATLKQNPENQKRIFIDTYTDWCGWCKRMDRDTFEDTLISKIMNHYFICVKFNAETKDEISFGGKTYKNANPERRGATNELAKHFKVNGYPNFLVLNKDLSIATTIPGYQNAKAFEVIVVFMGGGYDAKYSWEQFQKIYQQDIRPQVLKE